MKATVGDRAGARGEVVQEPPANPPEVVQEPPATRPAAGPPRPAAGPPPPEAVPPPPAVLPARPAGGAAGNGAPAWRRRWASVDRSPWWHRVRGATSLGLLAAAVAVMVLQFGQVEAAARRLSRVDPRWIVLAVAAEGGSMLAFARLQQRLLRAGGADVPLPTMTAVTLAADAVTGTLPGGVAWSAAWLFNQLGRRGVERFLRVWMFLVAGGVSSFALFLVVATGVETAGSRGPVASLRWLVFLLALVPVVALVLEALHDRGAVRELLDGIGGREGERGPVRRRLAAGSRSLVDRVTAVRLGRRGWLAVLLLALVNWLLDCLVVVAAMEALGVAVPWRAILVIYGLTQIAAALPLTPGGIGVVAGSLAALLSAYGVPLASALAVVLLYRILTFWAVVPVGWATWGALEWTSRRRVAA